jgi:hypothetical protein
MRPAGAAVRAAVGVGISAERQLIERVLDSGELDRIATSALNDERVQAAIRGALDSDGAKRIVDGLFESGTIDRFLDRLTTRAALWRLVDEVAQSPAVLAALSQQSLGFADQFGRAARGRTRKADRRVERTVDRLLRHGHNGDLPGPDAQGA